MFSFIHQVAWALLLSVAVSANEASLRSHVEEERELQQCLFTPDDFPEGGLFGGCWSTRKKKCGDLRLVPALEECGRGENKITWNAVGQNGTEGAAGKSAFELWKEANSTRANATMDDFLASLKGAAGDDGEGCSVASTTGGIDITCGATTESLVDGEGCSVASTAAGVDITCGGTTESLVDGATGPTGEGCSVASTTGGVDITCGGSNVSLSDGKSAFELWKEANSTRANATMDDFVASLKGAAGDDGEGCLVASTGGGVDITCGGTTESLVDGEGCSIAPATDGVDITCGGSTESLVNGKSAFELWMEANSTRANATMKDFLASLKGVAGDDGEGCSVASTAGGVDITCGGSTESLSDGEGCSVASTTGGVDITCGGSTESLSDGEGCSVAPATDGVDITCGGTTESLSNGEGCSVASTTGGVDITCGGATESLSNGEGCSIGPATGGVDITCGGTTESLVNGEDGLPGTQGPKGDSALSYMADSVLKFDPATSNTANNGGNQAHENRQPYLAINYIIALQGTFPSRNRRLEGEDEEEFDDYAHEEQFHRRLSEPFIGEIRMFAGNFNPRSWALCNGQSLQIAQYSALFSILGTTYGGDGRTNFLLPDLQGRVPIHPGSGTGLTSYNEGDRGGQETVTLTAAKMPSHSRVIPERDYRVQSITFPPSKTVFVTSSPYDGNLVAAANGMGPSTTFTDGLLAADFICQRHAFNASLPQPDKYVAWLSNSTENAKERLMADNFMYPDSDLKSYIRAGNGTIIANNLVELTDDGFIDAPINRDENGNVVTIAEVWTGSNANGDNSGASYCGDWTDGSSSVNGTVGDPQSVGRSWSQTSARLCDEMKPLYCFEKIAVE